MSEEASLGAGGRGDPTAVPPAPPKAERLTSLDAYRGFIMLLMASAIGVGFSQIYKDSLNAQGAPFPGIGFWKLFAEQTGHVEWVGCAFWDLIQPAFMFMVGVAMPYSYASRQARGELPSTQAWHAAWRSLVLVLLGVLLASNGRPESNFSFTIVLPQIGLGYFFVFLLLGRGPRVQALAAAGILVATWLFFVLYPAPGPDFDWKAAGVGDNVEKLTGLFGHWNKNANAAAAFDRWFLNLFPRSKEFLFEGGGYQTLNFVPSMATMLFGILAGELLRGPRTPMEKFTRLVAAGAAALVVGLILQWTLCPIIKRIWTPSWAVYSAGWVLLMLAGFYGLVDICGWKRWTFPLVVVGMNSIAMYMMFMLIRGWFGQTLKTHLGASIFGPPYGPLLECAAVLFCLWLVCLWMYRRKIFLRI
jgi:heparan-alpha-glucosaminide N-acetyltransferase